VAGSGTREQHNVEGQRIGEAGGDDHGWLLRKHNAARVERGAAAAAFRVGRADLLVVGAVEARVGVAMGGEGKRGCVAVADLDRVRVRVLGFGLVV